MNSSVSHLRAICIALAGFAFWTLSDVMTKLASGTTMPKHEIMMVGCASGMAVILAVTLPRGGFTKLKPKRPAGLLALGLLYASNYLIAVWVWPRIPLANFYTIYFLSPVVISILAALFLHERLDWKHGLAILAGFGGVIIAVDPAGLLDDMNRLLVYGAVFVSMLSYATQMLLLRILGPHESRECTVFYLRVVGFACAIGLGMVLGFGGAPARGVAYAVASGVVGAVGWLFMAQAYKLAPAATVAPFHYSQIVVGGLFGYLIWQDIPGLHMIMGAAVIIGSGLYIAAHTRKTGALAKTLAEKMDL